MGLTGIISLSMHWLWICVVVVMLIIEASTMGLTTIWFAGGALAAMIASFITDSFLIQLLVFAVISLVLVYFTRPLAVKKINMKAVKTNVNAVIGEKGIAQSDIKVNEKGTVRADNKMWTAVLAEGSPEISEGETVIVERIEGVKLIVKKEIN